MRQQDKEAADSGGLLYYLVLKRVCNCSSSQARIGCSATAAVIVNKKLFVANVGDTRAVLCSQLPSGELRVTKLSVDHVLGNEDEVSGREREGDGNSC